MSNANCLTKKIINLAKDEGFHEDDNNDTGKIFKSHAKPSTNTTGLDKLSEFLKSVQNDDVGPSKYYWY